MTPDSINGNTTLERPKVQIGFVSPRLPGKPPVAGLSDTGRYSDFTYHNGPVINTAQVHILFVGNWTGTTNQNRLARLTHFVKDLLNSRYMNILSQYGCGTTGTVASTATVAAPRNNLLAADVHNIIQTAINNHQIPEPTDQATCALLYLDDAIAVNDASVSPSILLCEATSDTGFGYHYHFVTTAGHTYPFAVVPGLTDICLKHSCPPGTGCTLQLSQTQEQRQTQVTSHELSEMFSDPQLNAWYSPFYGENGDICVGQSATITVGSNTWTVQKMYSKYDDMNTNGATTCITDSGPLPDIRFYPAAAGSALTGFFFPSDSTEHVFYLAIDNHVDELWLQAGTGAWHHDDVTAGAAGNPPGAAPGSALTGFFFPSDSTEHVFYLAIDNHVHELWLQAGTGAWHHDDVTAGAAAS